VNGRIIGISGPTVSVELAGLKLYERVTVGHARMMGEVVRLERGRSIVQVYESTRGLSLGEPAVATGTQLTVKLGPGLLGQMFDGLQRPLESLYAEHGPFIQAGRESSRSWNAQSLHFVPAKKPGDSIRIGEAIGYVEEGPIRHHVLADQAGVIDGIREGELDPQSPAVSLSDGRQILAFHDWPVRLPRPYRRKLTHFEPLITGQRCIDFLFPLARGGSAIFPGALAPARRYWSRPSPSLRKRTSSSTSVAESVATRWRRCSMTSRTFETRGPSGR
jgi:V/A-type H+/Na+-transporting ATPase subunit A